MSNSSQFGGSSCAPPPRSSPEPACLFPAANLRQKSPHHLVPPRREGTGDLGYTSRGWGAYFGSLLPASKIAASNVTSYKTLESFLFSLSLSRARCRSPTRRSCSVWRRKKKKERGKKFFLKKKRREGDAGSLLPPRCAAHTQGNSEALFM